MHDVAESDVGGVVVAVDDDDGVDDDGVDDDGVDDDGR